MKDQLEKEWCKLYCDYGLISDYRQRLVKNYGDLQKKILPGSEKSTEDQYRIVRTMEV